MTDDETGGSITTGGLVRPMFRLAWPIVALQLLQVTYNIADTIWLGRLSAPAVGAVSLAFPVIFLLISVAGGFTAAGAILVAQYTGAESEGSAGKVAGQTLSFVSLLAIGLGFLGYLVTDEVLGLLPSQEDTAETVIPLAAQYMEIIFLGMVFMFGFFVFSALMRGYGDTRTPMRVMFISVALNVVLDPLLIFGWGPFPHLGIQGAAVATVFSRGVASVLGLYVLFVAGAGPDVRLADLTPDLSYIADIVRLGVPSALEQSGTALGLITLYALVVQFTPPVVAAFGLGARLNSLVFLPAMGLGRATNTMVGQNLGAENPERAERAVWLAAKVSGAVLLGVAVLAVLFPRAIVSVFLGQDVPQAEATIRYGSEYLRVVAAGYAFIGVFQVVLGAYRGAGNTKTALVFSLFALWLVRIPAVYVLAFVADLGPTGIWFGMAIGPILGAVAATAWFTRGTWKRAYIDGPDQDEYTDGESPGGEAPEGAVPDGETPGEESPAGAVTDGRGEE